MKSHTALGLIAALLAAQAFAFNFLPLALLSFVIGVVAFYLFVRDAR